MTTPAKPPGENPDGFDGYRRARDNALGISRTPEPAATVVAREERCDANVFPSGLCGNSREAHGKGVGQIYSHPFVPQEESSATPAIVAREDYGPRVLCAHRFGNGARCSWTRDIHEASTREIGDHQFTTPPTPDSSDDAAALEMIAWEIGDRWANKPGVPGDPRRTLHLFDAVREALAAGRRLEREACRLIALLSVHNAHSMGVSDAEEAAQFIVDAIARRGQP